ncbi:MAG TPA: D-glycerate dehydrogenase, partial [Firmicutes bacterium]|nr:D-glycerate dehydrogenase [Bacillota bacterium]
MFNVFVTRELPGDGLEKLKQHCNVEVFPQDRDMTKEELLKIVPKQDALITMLSNPIDEEVMAAGPRLKVIANYAVGFNNIDLQAATKRGIPIVNTPDVLSDATADLAWALLMATARRVVEGDQMVRAGEFTGWAPELLLGVEIHGKTLGIIGAGRIGQAVAQRAAGFKMKTLYYNRNRLPKEVEKECNMAYADLDTLLKTADFVSLHCPLTPATKYLIGKRELELMKPTAVLINTARGPVVNETDLVEALAEGLIFGAGLDVFEDEPALKPGLADLPNTVLAPHIGSAAWETRSQMTDMVARDVLAALQGKRP